MSRGRFITLEGAEGAGKSTLAAGLAEWLRSQGLVVVLTREPGGTPLAERVRGVLLEPAEERYTPLAETLLMYAARAVHVENRIRPALERGEWVVCDRFSDASYAYQGAGRGVASGLLDALTAAVQHGIEPDRTLLLDLPVEVGLARARARGVAADRFEREPSDFFARVHAAYLARARQFPQRFRVLCAEQPAEAVLAQARAVLGELLSGGRS